MRSNSVVVSHAIDILVSEEGFEEYPYVDTEGYVTIGYGLKISAAMQPFSDFNSFPLMPQSVAEEWMKSIVTGLHRDMHNIDALDKVLAESNIARTAVLLSMAYQVGLDGLLKFKNTLALLEDRNFEGASIEMLDSKWHTQSANRAERHADMMNGGYILDYYL